MSKVKQNNIKDAEVEKVTNKKTTPSPEDAKSTLRVQLEEHLKQVEYHRTMATKAQGALEVLLQLYPDKEQNDG